MAVEMRQATVCICDKCNNEWSPQKQNQLPIKCPKCQSYKWNITSDLDDIPNDFFDNDEYEDDNYEE